MSQVQEKEEAERRGRSRYRMDKTEREERWEEERKAGMAEERDGSCGRVGKQLVPSVPGLVWPANTPPGGGTHQAEVHQGSWTTSVGLVLDHSVSVGKDGYGYWSVVATLISPGPHGGLQRQPRDGGRGGGKMGRSNMKGTRKGRGTGGKK